MLYLLHVSRDFIQHYFCLHILMNQKINSMHQMMCENIYVVFRRGGEKVGYFFVLIFFAFKFNSLNARYIFMLCCCLLTFFKINFFKKFCQERRSECQTVWIQIQNVGPDLDSNFLTL